MTVERRVKLDSAPIEFLYAGKALHLANRLHYREPGNRVTGSSAHKMWEILDGFCELENPPSVAISFWVMPPEDASVFESNLIRACSPKYNKRKECSSGDSYLTPPTEYNLNCWFAVPRKLWERDRKIDKDIEPYPSVIPNTSGVYLWHTTALCSVDEFVRRLSGVKQ